MKNLSKINETAYAINQYRIVEWLDEDAKTIVFLCCMMKGGMVYGSIFEATSHEQAFSWLRLMMGNYPGTVLREAS